MKLCTIDECTRPLRARGMCATHWARWRKHGDPHRVITPGETRVPADVRFWAKVEKTDGCWNWTAAIADTGYGTFNLGNRLAGAHRVAYEWLVGPIPAGLHLDHLCSNRRCVNPAHLEPVTPLENSLRGKMIGYHPNSPQECKRGHDWSETPPYLAHRSDGSVTRACRACTRESGRRYRARDLYGGVVVFADLASA